MRILRGKDIIEQEIFDKQPRQSTGKRLRQTNAYEIKEYLDNYVIGQNSEEDTAVAVYNHYKGYTSTIRTSRSKTNIIFVGPEPVRHF